MTGRHTSGLFLSTRSEQAGEWLLLTLACSGRVESVASISQSGELEFLQCACVREPQQGSSQQRCRCLFFDVDVSIQLQGWLASRARMLLNVQYCICGAERHAPGEIERLMLASQCGWWLCTFLARAQGQERQRSDSPTSYRNPSHA